MDLRSGLWLPTRRGHSGVSVAGGGGKAAGDLVASLSLTSADTWFDSPEGQGDMNTVLQHATADITVEGWVRVPTLPGGEAKLVTSVDDITGMYCSVSSTTFSFRAGANQVDLAIVQNTWTHFAWRFDASTGQLDAMVGGSGTWTSDATPAPISNPTNYVGMRFGDWGVGAGTPCKYADIRVWNDLRTAEEIADNYNKTVLNDSPGLVALWASYNAATGGHATIDDECNGNDDLTELNATSASWDTGDLPF
jgi:hypothetical protein